MPGSKTEPTAGKGKKGMGEVIGTTGQKLFVQSPGSKEPFEHLGALPAMQISLVNTHVVFCAVLS